MNNKLNPKEKANTYAKPKKANQTKTQKDKMPHKNA